MTTEPAADRPLRGLLPYLLESPRAFALVVASGIAFPALAITTATLGAWLVGSALAGDSAGDLAPGAVALCAAAALTGVAAWWQAYISHDWAFRVLAGLRVRLYDGLERAAPGRILGRRTGDLTASAMADVEKTEMFFAHTAGDYVGAVLVSLASLAVIAVLDVPTALVVLALMALVAVVPFVLAGRAGEQGRALRAELGGLNAEALDGVQGLRELTVFGRGGWYLDRLTARTRRTHRHAAAHARRAGAEQAVTDLLLSLGVVLLPLTAARGGLDVRWLPPLIVLGLASLGPIAAVSATARTLGEVRAAAARVLAIIGFPAHVADTGTRALDGTDAEVRFEDVRFRYDPAGPDVLAGASFTVRPGETVALVGRSGAGKTTCVNLLMRFWDAEGGRVLVGGRDVRTVPVAALRSAVTLVPQDVYLFNLSVRENIRLARPDATDEQVEAAARRAAAHDFVAALPEGYDTPCGERGARLSGGQRQRIAIARALLRETPVIVLDEAVSNLDAANERAVQRAVDEVRAHHTVITIAHRLSTIRAADRVVVLDGGRVAATGTHDELLARDAAYRELVAAQEGP
ncbi:ABC transporter ATP-binding protein [Actinomadura atramentaria]|uniref:ABC transporter ATP-binding protein n=1 Tax=Actinomadura atramentaria TaxID=1990 RepID=UPI00035DC71D|nr:ABC transporter ATP-binding protein [Actinomadura atramentaria]